MKVSSERIEGCQVALTVEVEPEEMEKALDGAYKRLVNKVAIPGFRKGKAPRALLERHIGKESMDAEALEHLVPELYDRAIEQEQVEAIGQPDVEMTQNDPPIFKATVPVRPVVELGDYHSIKVASEKVEITDENVDQGIENLRQMQATWEPVERSLAFGDLAVLDINSEIEEKPFIKKLGVQYQVLRDSVSPAPGFAEQLTGLNKDEEKEFKLKFPEDHPQGELAGKEAAFKVKITEIKEEKLPGLDNNLAKQVSPDFKTLAALKKEVAKNLQLRAEERARADFEERAVSVVVEQSQTDFPPVLVEMEINRLLNERARQLQMSGRGLDEYLKSINKTEEELREELRPLATKSVTASLVMSKLAEQEKIEVSDSDIDAEIEGMTKNTAEDKKDELKKLLDTPETRGSIRQSLMMRKTLERLVAIAKSPAKNQTEAEEEKK